MCIRSPSRAFYILPPKPNAPLHLRTRTRTNWIAALQRPGLLAAILMPLLLEFVCFHFSLSLFFCEPRAGRWWRRGTRSILARREFVVGVRRGPASRRRHHSAPSGGSPGKRAACALLQPTVPVVRACLASCLSARLTRTPANDVEAAVP